MAEQGHQPRVVVQLANGQEVPTSSVGGGQYLQSDEDHMDAVVQLASMGNVDFEESGMDDLAMSSPPPCGDVASQHMILSSTAGLEDDDVDVTGDQRQAIAPSGSQGRRHVLSGGKGTIHPPTSPSPPPSMTPPDHYGGHVVHHTGGKAPRRAQQVTTPGGTTVQAPPPPGMVADHCYGLPYQDHNYGGATTGAGGAAAGNGSAASSTVRLTSSSQQPLRSTGIRTSRSSISEENQEPFPIIGGLASYLGEDDSDDQGGLGPTATSTPLLSAGGRTLGARSVGGDSLGITAYHRSGSVRDQGPGVPYYQRYVSSHHADSATFGHQYASPSYSQSLVTIGGRTYIRQVAAPTSTVGGYRGAGRDYLGISSPNQSIYNISGSPYGATRRVVPGGVTGVTTFKRAGRPRTRGGVQTHTTLVPALPHGSMLGDGSPAPIIAPSRGGRPSGRGRGGGQTGARRARGAAAAGSTSQSPVVSLTQRRETKNAAAVLAEENRKAQEAEELNNERLANPATKQELVNEVQKKYQKLLESPLPSAKTAKQRKSAKSSLSPSKQLIDVENDRPDRTPSPITSVILAARADAERRKSRDAAELVVESVVRSPIRGPQTQASTPASRKRQASPDFSLFEDPCVKEERDRDRAQAEAAAREQARKLMAASPLIGIPTSPGPVLVRTPVHNLLQDVYPRPVDHIKVDDLSTSVNAEDAADDTSDATSSEEEEETAESSDESDSESDALDTNWSGDYVTRCLCGMQHNDEFMISCDQCDVWQHCRCMGVDTKRVPDHYLCEKCKPRPLKNTPAQAKELQAKKLAKWAKDKERRKQQRARRQEHRAKEREKRRHIRKTAKKGAMSNKPMSDEYLEIAENDYTTDAKRFIEMQGDSSGQAMLGQLSEQLCQVMFVAPSVQGLVSVHLVPPNQPVAEYRGRVCLKAECNGRDKTGRIQPHCLLYSGFTTGSSSTDAVLCIDARAKGSAARFARRSCRPNTQVKHVIKDERLHLLLISTELIERGTEVTIPFDYDFRSSKFPLECACGATAEKDGDNEEDDVCPIKELNRNLKVKKAQTARNRTQARREKQKQITDAREADQSRRAKEAQLRKAANKNSTAVKRAAQKVKAKLAVKSKKMVKKQQAAIAAGKRRVGGLKLKSKRISSRTMSTASSVKEEKPSTAPTEGRGKTAVKQQPLPQPSPPPPPSTSRRLATSAVKRSIGRTRTRSSATDSGSDAKSPRPAVVTKKEEPLEPMDYTLPEDRNKPISREERKLQMAVAQIAKLEENAKRKAENKQRRHSGERTASPPSAQKKRASASPLRRGRIAKKPSAVVVHRKKTANKWKRGQTNKVKAAMKSKRKPGSQTASAAKQRTDGADSRAEDVSSDEPDSDSEEKSGRSTRGQVAAVDSNARGPPRKRWGSSTAQSPASPPSVGVSTRSGGSPSAVGLSSMSPAGGGKKRWLRQAMSEESVDEPTSPLKKRRPGLDGPIIIPTEPLDPAIDPMTPVEAAQLLTQMAADPQTPASPPPNSQAQHESFGSPRLIPTVAVDFPGIVAPTVIPPASGDRAPLLSQTSHEEAQPARRERRKVTLDEYKKRKGPPRDAKKGGDDGSKLSDTDSMDAPGTSTRTTTSFIPTLTEAELLESGRSHRLSALPDPNQIGKSTVSVDDLKRRIYGKQFTAHAASSSQPDGAQDQHLPPPPPPPKKTEEQQRMSLADRLRTEFGLDEPSAESSLPPPPPPPPPVDALDAQWGNGPSTQPSVAYQTRSSRRW